MKDALKQKPYWQAVLEEVLNKHNPDYPMVYTTVRNVELEEERKRLGKRKQRRVKPRSEKRITYLLTCANAEIQFTQREMDIAKLFLLGKTAQETADTLHLAIRTIEYYTKNMRQKLFCKHKRHLVEKLKELGCAEMA